MLCDVRVIALGVCGDGILCKLLFCLLSHVVCIYYADEISLTDTNDLELDQQSLIGTFDSTSVV